MPQIGWLINDSNLLLTVLDNGNSKIKSPVVLVSDESLLFINGAHNGGRGEKSLESIFYKDTNPVHEGCSHDLIKPQMPYLAPLCQGLGFNIWIWSSIIIQTTSESKALPTLIIW